MSEALAVQMNGFGSALCLATYSSMASSSSGTLVKLSRLMHLSVMSRKKRSTMFSHEAPVGVKCMTKRGCLESQAFFTLWSMPRSRPQSSLVHGSATQLPALGGCHPTSDAPQAFLDAVALR
jgi:hypothetical protein